MLKDVLSGGLRLVLLRSAWFMDNTRSGFVIVGILSSILGGAPL